MVHGPGVVTGRYGSVGAVVFVADSFWPLNTALYVREFHGNSRRFVFWLLTSMSTMMTESEGSKAAVPGVDRNDLHEIMVPVPTHNEQEVIARYLDRETAKIDALVAKIIDCGTTGDSSLDAEVKVAAERLASLARNAQPVERTERGDLVRAERLDTLDHRRQGQRPADIPGWRLRHRSFVDGNRAAPQLR